MKLFEWIKKSSLKQYKEEEQPIKKKATTELEEKIIQPILQRNTHYKDIRTVPIPQDIDQCKAYHAISLLGAMEPEWPKFLDIIFKTKFPNSKFEGDPKNEGTWLTITDGLENFYDTEKGTFLEFISKYNTRRSDQFQISSCIRLSSSMFSFFSTPNDTFDWIALKTLFKKSLDLFA